jgi:uncharacterized protein (TIGR00730 family)
LAPFVVTLFGSSRPIPGQPAYELAYKLGRAIGENGWTLCNGGYGGTMEASARGASEVGGHTIGVTCKTLGRTGPNPYIREEVPAADLLARLDTLVRFGNAYVALPGGTGTLLELALVWELTNKALLERERPVILLTDHWRDLIPIIQSEQPDAREPQVAHNVPAAIAALQKAAQTVC